MSLPATPGDDPSPPAPGAGHPTPQVQLLVRSMGRPLLEQALASVAAQTQDGLEVLVVNASGQPHPPLPAYCGRFPLRLIEPGRALGRAAAANAALDAATAPWLLFLDDDDQIDSHHVQRLLDAVLSTADARAAYAGVRLLDAQGRSAGQLDEPWDARRLWLANFLPIHAVLFARSLVDEGCRFDEGFVVYEDWDFWQQMAQRHPLQHVPGLSATYRLVGDSGLSAQRDEALSLDQRLAFYRKWLPRLAPQQAERIAAFGEAQRAQRQQALQALAQAQGDLAAALADGARLRADAAAAEQRHAGQLQQIRQQLDTTQHALQAQDSRGRRQAAELQAALSAYARLEQGYRAVTGSLSWRLTAPLRAVRGVFTQPDPGRRLLRALPVSSRARQRIKQALGGHALGRRLLRRLAPQAVPVAPAPMPPRPDVDKQQVRAEAEADLGRFLAGSERIDLRCADAAPAVSVIVVMYNQAGLSRLCLQALAASTGIAFETLLVDNGSSDRIPQLLARVDGATLLRPGQNLGFLRAVNLAAAQARGRHLLLLNNDALVEPQTLARAVARLDADAGADAVGGPILLWDGRLQEAGSIVWRDGSCQGYGRGDDPQRPAYGFRRDVDYCSGACLLLRRIAFERLGGFDDAYAPAYYEETDFCVRLWQQGRRVVYDPAVRVRHFEFASEVAAGQAIELQGRNRARFVERHRAFLQQQAEPGPSTLVKARQRLRPGARRVLVIDDRVPLPWLGQGYPRAASLVAALADDGHAVTHYPLQFPHEAAADVARTLPDTVEVMLDHGLPGLEAFLRARQGHYDTVIVSRPHNMAVLRQLNEHNPHLLQGVRLVYDAEAMFSLRDIGKAALDGKPMRAAEQVRAIDAELALTRGAHAVVAVSALEAEHYRRAGHADVHVLGHQLEPAPGDADYESRSGFVFVGALTADNTPNSDSVRWFVHEVWPRISARLGPLVQLHLVGPCTAPSVLALQGPTVQLHGAADTLAPHLDAARVFVVPTRYAAGIPHKAHEAAARGLPMVVTPLIAQQLGWQHIVAVGADAEAFAHHCIELHENKRRWTQMRADVIDAVTRDCAPAAFRAALRRVLGAAAAGTAATAAATPAAAPDAVDDSVDSADSADDKRTAALWGRDAEQRADARHGLRHWASHPVTAAEINRQVSGDPGLGWVAWLKQRHFAQRRARGLSLGSGSGAVVVDALALGIVEQMEGVDIAPAAVAVARARAAAAGLDGRAHFRACNINQLELHGPYDLILFEQSLHHVDALDAVLERCRSALAADGLFVLNEYVGPDRFQWSDEVERLMNLLLDCLPEHYRHDPDSGALKARMQRVAPEAVIALDPSEAIHSSAILAACGARFELVERRDFGGTLLQFMLADIAANFDPADERDVALMRLLTHFERELIRAGAIDSDFVLAVYRHRATAARLQSPR